ncbi:MAG: ferredoxin, partial [Cyanobacteria bacterium J083]
MTKYYKITIRDRQQGTEYHTQIPDNKYILSSVEAEGNKLPFSCRNGACTACAVKILAGEVYQPEAMGLSKKLQEQGYALLCVS